MTPRNAAKQIEDIIRPRAGDDAAFEAEQLTRAILNLSRVAFLTDCTEITNADLERLTAAAEKRESGYPLQYILGEWEFFSLPFFVGDGVLIPRADTELLAEHALAFLKSKPTAAVADLCSGSGCIAVAVAKNCPSAEVTALEKSEKAFCYLQKNIERNGVAVTPLLADVLAAAKGKYDLILSNPPYIESDVVPTLEKEVLCEPKAALDGGNDGLLFYRAIATLWLPHLNDGGAVMVEIGYNQAKAVSDIFKAAGLKNIRCFKDSSGNDRVITAEK